MESSFWDAGGGLPDRPMLTSGQLAAAIVWAISQPPGVDVNARTIRPAGAPAARCVPGCRFPACWPGAGAWNLCLVCGVAAVVEGTMLDTVLPPSQLGRLRWLRE